MKKYFYMAAMAILVLFMSPVLLITKYCDWLTDGVFSEKWEEVKRRFP